MPEKLKLSTRKSLYPSIEIEIDDTTYQSRKFSNQLLISLAPLEEKINKKESDTEALFEWAKLVFGVNEKILEELEKAEVEEIYLYSQKELLNRQEKRMSKHLKDIKGQVETVQKATDEIEDIGKNVKRPGKKK